MELRGKTAIVTGSGRGIGRALAIRFAREGANVVCCARRESDIKETVKLIEEEGGNALAISTDVTDKSQVNRMVDKALETFGEISVLYNNAGSFKAIGGLWEIDPELWWQDVTVNVRGPMLCCQAVLPHMIKQDEGIIINMNGGGSTVPLPGGSGYGSSKAALMRLTDTLAMELKEIGSRVLVFAMGPGLVRTDTTEYQVETPEGRKWIPSTKSLFDSKQDKPPEECARATVELIRMACPELSGRIFSVWTDLDKVKKSLADIQEKDLYVMRYRT